jgi:non-ribosomal peptide synthetase component F
LINRILWQLETFPWEEDEVVCRRTPITFIDAQAEIWTALLCAVPLWVPPRGELEAQGVASIVRSAAEQGVTRITLIPSQLSLLLDMYSRSLASDWPSLKHVTISGESASSRLVSSFTALLPDVTLVNLYGSTEVAGDVTYSRLDTLAKIDGPSAPIGIPISGNTVYILGRSNDGRWIEAP